MILFLYMVKVSGRSKHTWRVHRVDCVYTSAGGYNIEEFGGRA